jgi:hypothetical protein
MVGNHWSDISFCLEQDVFQPIRNGLEEFIQYLKQPKPTHFVAEIVPNFPKMPINGKDFPFIDVLKTTTKNGKTYLVGK